MTTLTSAPPDYRPRPLVVNKTPCRTGLFLFLILLGTAVLTVDRYLTNDAVRRVEDIEAWGTRETAQIVATQDAQARLMIAVRTSQLIAEHNKLLQDRLDELSMDAAKLLIENMQLKADVGAPTTGITDRPKVDQNT